MNKRTTFPQLVIFSVCILLHIDQVQHCRYHMKSRRGKAIFTSRDPICINTYRGCEQSGPC